MAENFFAMIDRVKRNIRKNAKNPEAMIEALELALIRGREDFNADPVGATLESANLGGLSGLAGVIGSTASKGAKMGSFAAPQDEALEIARRNAVEMLGLPENNTAMDRARAMGFDTPAVHFSRHGVDVTELDSGKYANAPFDAVGTHVGSAQAAMDRFANTSATTDQIKGSTYPVFIKKGDEFVDPNGNPWDEDALNAALLERGGYATARKTYPELNRDLRRDLFNGSGYDSIPYVNDVEGKGSISYIVPPKNIRSRFAAFDPARRNEANLLASRLMPFGLAGLLGLNQYNEEQ